MVGYERTVNWVSSEDSIIPSYLYDKTVHFMGEEYKYTSMETGLHQRDILPTLYDTISGLTHTSSEGTFNWQRVVDMSPYEQVVPSDLGMPIFTEMRTPVVASIRGRFSSDIMRSSEGLSKVDAAFEVL